MPLCFQQGHRMRIVFVKVHCQRASAVSGNRISVLYAMRIMNVSQSQIVIPRTQLVYRYGIHTSDNLFVYRLAVVFTDSQMGGEYYR